MVKFVWNILTLFIHPYITYLVCHAIWLSPVDRVERWLMVLLAGLWGFNDFLDKLKGVIA